MISSINSQIDVVANFFAAHGCGKHSWDIAEQIVAHAGGIVPALSFSDVDLRNIGVSQSGINVMSFLRKALYFTLDRQSSAHLPLSKLSAVIHHLQANTAHLSTEALRILFLDGQYRLITDEIVGVGDSNSVHVCPRMIIARSLNLNANNIILVHNHPSGDPSPTDSDITITRELRQLCNRVGINILDHIIIARDAHCSLRALSLI